MIGNKSSVVALGMIGAVGLLLAAFFVVWLVPRGPEPGSAAPQSTNAQSPAASKGTNTGAGVSSAPAPAAAALNDQPRISVVGTGIVSVKPDIANLQVGVQIQKATLDVAQSEAANKMDAIMKQLKAAGIDDKDISTMQYNVEPVMNYRENQAPEVTGFRVTNILNVKIRDIARAGKTIDTLISSGANTVYGLNFSVADPSAASRQAREAAMKSAREKAEQLASLGGVTLGAPIAIDEGGPSVPPIVMPSNAYGGAAAGKAADTAINPGQQEVRVDLNVVYAIK